jgi:hypothetical protein
MTARLRVLLAWLMLAAIPLQGFAAASMLFCTAATHDVQASATLGDPAHASHVHAGAAGAKAQVTSISDGAHPCSLCASCCHSVAITEVPSIVALVSAPQAETVDSFVPMLSRPSPVPDKPPRA